MEPNLKALWLIALRSGDYLQGKGRLREENAFCCLGVLCDVYDPEQWYRVVPSNYFLYSGSGEMMTLPPDLKAAIKIPDSHEVELIRMNDEGDTFAQIADWIEENL